MTRTASDTPTSLPDLTGRRIAFSGKLASMSRQEAHKLVRRSGGIPTSAVGPKTDLLVVGEEGWPLQADGQIRRKLHLAIRMSRQGRGVEIISETQWLAQLRVVEGQGEVHRLYTPAMLARVLGVPLESVYSWIRRGLIRPARQVFRLKYFDFQEAAGAKRLAELVASGVSPQTIQRGLAALAGWLPNVERPLSQLALLAESGRMLVRRGERLVEPSGQRRFDFEPSAESQQPGVEAAESDPTEPHSAADWVAVAQQYEEDGSLDEAADAYRRALMLEGPNAETAFGLAHVLYRLGKLEAARERFQQAVECDPDYVEAWNNLGSVLAELGQHEAALDAFQCALAVHSDYPDALYNLADTLEELGRHDEAVPYWEAYLRHDSRSSWADEARRRLGQEPPGEKSE